MSPSPYRDEPHLAIEKARRLERENARLRSIATGLLVLALLLGAAAAWWFGMLCSLQP
jgi:hypothetical protein